MDLIDILLDYLEEAKKDPFRREWSLFMLEWIANISKRALDSKLFIPFVWYIKYRISKELKAKLYEILQDKDLTLEEQIWFGELLEKIDTSFNLREYRKEKGNE